MIFVYILGGLCVLAAVLMVVAVMIQNSKGGGINTAFNTTGATQMLGARRSNEYIEKITWGLAIAVAVLALGTNVATSLNKGTTEDNSLKIQKTIEGMPAKAPAAADPTLLQGDQAAPKEGAAKEGGAPQETQKVPEAPKK